MVYVAQLLSYKKAKIKVKIFLGFPNGLPTTDNANTTQNVHSLCQSTKKKCLAPFRELLHKLNHGPSSNRPPVTCIVSDGVMSFTLRASEEGGIPNIVFWTTDTCRDGTRLDSRGSWPPLLLIETLV